MGFKAKLEAFQANLFSAAVIVDACHPLRRFPATPWVDVFIELAYPSAKTL